MSERTFDFFGGVLAGMHVGDTRFLVCMEFLFRELGCNGLAWLTT
jgi:hypothetical protein